MSSGRADQRWRRAGQPANERAEACCAAMNFEEKVAVALGNFDAVAHLGIPPLKYTDGPNGIRGPDNVTAFPAALALAATFDEGLAAVVFGDTDPGGRLPVTFPADPGQGPITGPDRWPGVDGDARYDEDILVGYRWYDAHGQQPLFCFGYGLSYGEYEYGQPSVERQEATGAVTVSLQVTNVGGRAGAEVVQLYVAAPAAAGRPPRHLKGFAKARLHPGASQEVTLRLDLDDLAAFDEATGAWTLHEGRYEILVGRSSRDLRGRAHFEVGTRTPVSP